MAESYTLSAEAARQIQRVVREQVRREIRRTRPSGSEIQPIYIAKTGTSGIDAMSSGTPGTADVTVQRVASDGTLEAAINESGDEVTVEASNLSSSVVAGDSYVPLTQEIVSGKLCVASGAGQYKSHCRFTLDLDSALATSDASQSATISHQWGYGIDHDTSITVYNLETHTADTYVFEGDSGHAGTATYDPDDDKWWIIQMECP